MDELQKMLKDFKVFTKYMSYRVRPTISLLLPLVHRLKINLGMYNSLEFFPHSFFLSFFLANFYIYQIFIDLVYFADSLGEYDATILTNASIKVLSLLRDGVNTRFKHVYEDKLYALATFYDPSTKARLPASFYNESNENNIVKQVIFF